MKVRHLAVALAMALVCGGGGVQAESVHLADGTPVRVRLKADLVSAQATEGSRVDFEVAQPVTLHGTVVIPEGSVAWGAVQLAKKGKALRFDIEGLRLPSLKDVKLRCSPKKTTNAGKDEIKVESHVGSDLGAPKGTEFSAYLDQDVTVEVGGTPGAPVSAPAPAPVIAAPAVPAQPAHAVVTPAAAPAAPVAPPAPVAAAPAVANPAPAAQSVAPAPAAAGPQPGEYITVECFSDPLGADILIDGEFHGNTPSILKIAPGKHELEYQLFGYKTHTETLTLTPGSVIRTLRTTLEKKE
jgi:hypothetical protein